MAKRIMFFHEIIHEKMNKLEKKRILRIKPENKAKLKSDAYLTLL